MQVPVGRQKTCDVCEPLEKHNAFRSAAPGVLIPQSLRMDGLGPNAVGQVTGVP